jgi:uncharacterized protein (DUF4415 family)
MNLKSDHEIIPELTTEQLALFKQVSPEDHAKFLSIDIVRVIENGEVKVKKVGRPKKKPEEKENVVAIRLSKIMIESLKKKAGDLGWQTYAKRILEEHLAE